MEFLFDTANLAEIERNASIYPFTGVTTNPTILKAEGRIDLYAHLRAIRRSIGHDRSLHVQVVARDTPGMLAEARAIGENVDRDAFIKVPATEDGLRAMRALKDDGVHVTATAIYSKIQGYLCIALGVDYLAPYVNRMANLDIDPFATIAALADAITRHGNGTKIVAASFKNIAQVNAALEAGAHAVTVAPALLHTALGSAPISDAVETFARDGRETLGGQSLPAARSLSHLG